MSAADYVEYERWRAAMMREARALGPHAWMIDDEPERRWWSPVRAKSVTQITAPRRAAR